MPLNFGLMGCKSLSPSLALSTSLNNSNSFISTHHPARWHTRHRQIRQLHSHPHGTPAHGTPPIHDLNTIAHCTPARGTKAHGTPCMLHPSTRHSLHTAPKHMAPKPTAVPDPLQTAPHCTPCTLRPRTRHRRTLYPCRPVPRMGDKASVDKIWKLAKAEELYSKD